ncbi:MAG: hypothetical protein IPH68_16815 [Chitinophagaceae bacterium]|nr:hypothetical protein [Chitinophagaceae bacterium]
MGETEFLFCVSLPYFQQNFPRLAPDIIFSRSNQNGALNEIANAVIASRKMNSLYIIRRDFPFIFDSVMLLLASTNAFDIAASREAFCPRNIIN